LQPVQAAPVQQFSSSVLPAVLTRSLPAKNQQVAVLDDITVLFRSVEELRGIIKPAVSITKEAVRDGVGDGVRDGDGIEDGETAEAKPEDAEPAAKS
jgi:hypothetical protein